MAVTVDDQISDALDTIAQDPDDLDGHTIDELADYLDNARQPYDPTIEGSPACRHALAALDRLRRLTPALLTDEGPEDDEDGWIAGVLSHIAIDAHAGADLPLQSHDPDVRLVITEGALRGLIRAAGDDEPGFLAGRIRFTGDLAALDEPITVSVNVTVLQGTVIPTAVEELRERIRTTVLRHTDYRDLRIDITVQDLDIPTRTGGTE